MDRRDQTGNTSAFHEDIARGPEIKLSQDRTFGLAFGAFFSAVGLWPLLRQGPPRTWALAVAGCLMLAALAYPRCLHPLNRLAAALAGVLHRVISPLVAGVFFFAIVTPAGLLIRLGRRDPLRLRFSPDETTYWIPRDPPGPASESMANQY